MNIKQAKQEITNTLKAYLAKDQLGNYLRMKRSGTATSPCAGSGTKTIF